MGFKDLLKNTFSPSVLCIQLGYYILHLIWKSGFIENIKPHY